MSRIAEGHDPGRLEAAREAEGLAELQHQRAGYVNILDSRCSMAGQCGSRTPPPASSPAVACTCLALQQR